MLKISTGTERPVHLIFIRIQKLFTIAQEGISPQAKCFFLLSQVSRRHAEKDSLCNFYSCLCNFNCAWQVYLKCRKRRQLQLHKPPHISDAVKCEKAINVKSMRYVLHFFLRSILSLTPDVQTILKRW